MRHFPECYYHQADKTFALTGPDLGFQIGTGDDDGLARDLMSTGRQICEAINQAQGSREACIGFSQTAGQDYSYGIAYAWMNFYVSQAAYETVNANDGRRLDLLAYELTWQGGGRSGQSMDESHCD